MSIPISLLVDDGAPVNALFFHDPSQPHPFLVPNSLARDFGDLCEKHGARGKLSVLPMPFCLGTIDDKLNHVPSDHLSEFLAIVSERIAPRFDITPELLTHMLASRLDGSFHHVIEDAWIPTATVEEMTDYVALALEILDRVGLTANGVTSPWDTGSRNEQDYSEAIGKAQWRVHQQDFTWYFLHVLDRGDARQPRIMHEKSEDMSTVIQISANTGDVFWNTQSPMSTDLESARAVALAGADTWLSADGKTGRVPEVIAQGCPVTLQTHWQALYSDGTFAGLWGLEQVFDRLEKHYGADLEWLTCYELAKITVSRKGAKSAE